VCDKLFMMNSPPTHVPQLDATATLAYGATEWEWERPVAKRTSYGRSHVDTLQGLGLPSDNSDWRTAAASTHALIEPPSPSLDPKMDGTDTVSAQVCSACDL
jgi:hypothetical protein